MYRLSTKACAFFFLLAGWAPIVAQTAAQLDSPDVKRVAARLACQCGSCKSSTACEMPGGCGYCKRVKTQIAQMQAGGKSDKSIINTLVKQDGESYLAEPGTWGWLTPFLAAAGGLGVIFWFVRRSLHQPMAATVPSVDDSVFERYHDKIERDLEKLDG